MEKSDRIKKIMEQSEEIKRLKEELKRLDEEYAEEKSLGKEDSFVYSIRRREIEQSISVAIMLQMAKEKNKTDELQSEKQEDYSDKSYIDLE